MLMWSSEIEKKVKAQRAAVPLRQKLVETFVPEKRDVKNAVPMLMVLAATPVSHLGGSTSFAFWCVWSMAVVLVHLSMVDRKLQREQAKLLDQYRDLTNTMHDDALASRVVESFTPPKGTDWRMN